MSNRYHSRDWDDPTDDPKVQGALNTLHSDKIIKFKECEDPNFDPERHKARQSAKLSAAGKYLERARAADEGVAAAAEKSPKFKYFYVDYKQVQRLVCLLSTKLCPS
jgi:hypothetical protein